MILWVYDMRQYTPRGSGGFLVGYNQVGSTVGRFGALSGPWGKGALPEGLYTHEGAVILPVGIGPYSDEMGFSWWVKLNPTFETTRTGLGVHPDGNVEGTLGCIGLTDPDTRPAYELLRDPGLLMVLS